MKKYDFGTVVMATIGGAGAGALIYRAMKNDEETVSGFGRPSAPSNVSYKLKWDDAGSWDRIMRYEGGMRNLYDMDRTVFRWLLNVTRRMPMKQGVQVLGFFAGNDNGFVYMRARISGRVVWSALVLNHNQIKYRDILEEIAEGDSVSLMPAGYIAPMPGGDVEVPKRRLQTDYKLRPASTLRYQVIILLKDLFMDLLRTTIRSKNLFMDLLVSLEKLQLQNLVCHGLMCLVW